MTEVDKKVEGLKLGATLERAQLFDEFVMQLTAMAEDVIVNRSIYKMVREALVIKVRTNSSKSLSVKEEIMLQSVARFGRVALEELVSKTAKNNPGKDLVIEASLHPYQDGSLIMRIILATDVGKGFVHSKFDFVNSKLAVVKNSEIAPIKRANVSQPGVSAVKDTARDLLASTLKDNGPKTERQAATVTAPKQKRPVFIGVPNEREAVIDEMIRVLNEAADDATSHPQEYRLVKDILKIRILPKKFSSFIIEEELSLVNVRKFLPETIHGLIHRGRGRYGEQELRIEASFSGGRSTIITVVLKHNSDQAFILTKNVSLRLTPEKLIPVKKKLGRPRKVGVTFDPTLLKLGEKKTDPTPQGGVKEIIDAAASAAEVTIKNVEPVTQAFAEIELPAESINPTSTRVFTIEDVAGALSTNLLKDIPRAPRAPILEKGMPDGIIDVFFEYNPRFWSTYSADGNLRRIQSTLKENNIDCPRNFLNLLGTREPTAAQWDRLVGILSAGIEPAHRKMSVNNSKLLLKWLRDHWLIAQEFKIERSE